MRVWRRLGVGGAVLLALLGACSTDERGDSGETWETARFAATAVSWVQQTSPIKPDRQEHEGFGVGLSLSAERAFVSAPSEASGRGAVYVFTRRSGAWNKSQRLVASDGAAAAGFGYALAQEAGTLLVVGTSPSHANKTGVYVYTLAGDAWTEGQFFTPDNTPWTSAVAISGGTAVLGSGLGAGTKGLAHVFVRSAGVWSQQQELAAVGGKADDRFGDVVALSGDTLAVTSAGANAARGSVSIFVRSGSTWALQQTLTAPSAKLGDRFGAALALDGNSLVVGAPGYDATLGAVFVFVRTGSTWAMQAKLVASDPAAGSELGGALALQGDRAIVGASRYDAPVDDAGTAYVFARSGVTWTEQQRLSATALTVDAAFGQTVALHGNTALFGAPGWTNQSGFVYSFGFGLGPGGACSDAEDCALRHCSAGICCSTPCDATCEACGANGTCAPAAEGATCLDAFCATATSRSATSVCAGASFECKTPFPVSCQPGYRCVDAACKTNCSSDSDCDQVLGYRCAGGACSSLPDPCAGGGCGGDGGQGGGGAGEGGEAGRAGASGEAGTPGANEAGAPAEAGAAGDGRGGVSGASAAAGAGPGGRSFGGTAGTSGDPGGGGTAGTSADGVGGDAHGTTDGEPRSSSSCGCRVAGGQPGAQPAWFVLAGLAVSMLRRRVPSPRPARGR